MPSKQHQHYRTRAAEERIAASKVQDSNVAGMHEQIAEMYDALEKELDREIAAAGRRPNAA